MKMLRHTLKLSLPVFILLPMLAQAQDREEEDDLDLFKEAVQLLERAKLSDALDQRRILQDLDIEAIPDTEKIINEAKNRLKELQAQGLVSPEVLDQVREAVEGDSPEAPSSSSDVLGPEPEKALKFTAVDRSDMITIENSRKFAGSLDDGILVFVGNVLVRSDDEFTLRCDRLEVHLDDAQEVELAVATGRMVIIEGSSEDGPVEARCQHAVYRKDVMHLREWPEISMPGRLWKARDKDASIKLVVDENGKIDPEAEGNFQISLKKPESEKAS